MVGYGFGTTYTCKTITGSVVFNNVPSSNPLKNVEKRCFLSG